MNVVDSSAWLEYFANTKNAGNFSKAIENTSLLLVPSIVVYEVFKKILQEKNEISALGIIAHMKQGKIVDIDLEISIRAATLSKEKKIPMADSIILSIAQKYGATLWTQDADFKGFKGVKYFPK